MEMIKYMSWDFLMLPHNNSDIWIRKVGFLYLFLQGLLTQHCSSDKIEKNEMGGTCSAYGREEKRIQSIGGETWGKETTWEIQA